MRHLARWWSLIRCLIGSLTWVNEATYDGMAGGSRYGEIKDDLPVIAAAYGLGEVQERQYLSTGLMNGNWRLGTARGVFALKRIVDVPLAVARRNLAVLAVLADTGVPVRRPLLGSEGDPVVEIGGRGYCLIPWTNGSHEAGTTLSLDQAAELGVALGEIHRNLNDERVSHLLPPARQEVTVSVTTPEAALAEADRFLGLVADMRSPTAFDHEVAVALEDRKVLLEKHAAERPASDVVGPFGWTHGDFQYRNVLWWGETIAGVIDWDRIRVRPFGEEVARTATVQFGGEDGFLDLERTAAFVSGYRSVVPLSAESLTDAVERLWWKRMSDYWQLVFHYDRGDDSCDGLFLPAERFLGWWTERRALVQGAFAATP